MQTIIIEYLTKSNQKIIEKFHNLPINIGASSLNDLVFSEYHNVSPNHTIINKVDQNILIFNLSTFGTFLNEKQITKAVLNSGDEIKLGLNGPKFIVNFGHKPNKEETSRSNIKYRWYDKNTLTSKAFELLRTSSDENAIKVTKALINHLNRQDSNLIYIKPDVNIKEEIEKIPNCYRWYDLNDCIRHLVEGLKLVNPEMQQDLSLQIIMMLDSLEIEQQQNQNVSKDTKIEANFSTETEQKQYKTCLNCKYDNPLKNSFCINCGQNLNENAQKQSVTNCPNCNELVNVNNKYCFNCSYKLK